MDDASCSNPLETQLQSLPLLAGKEVQKWIISSRHIEILHCPLNFFSLAKCSGEGVWMKLSYQIYLIYLYSIVLTHYFKIMLDCQSKSKSSRKGTYNSKNTSKGIIELSCCAITTLCHFLHNEMAV